MQSANKERILQLAMYLFREEDFLIKFFVIFVQEKIILLILFKVGKRRFMLSGIWILCFFCAGRWPQAASLASCTASSEAQQIHLRLLNKVLAMVGH